MKFATIMFSYYIKAANTEREFEKKHKVLPVFRIVTISFIINDKSLIPIKFYKNLILKSKTVQKPRTFGNDKKLK